MQDVLVTVIAAGAAAVVLRRSFAFLRPGKSDAACSCGSSGKGCKSAAAASQTQSTPLIQITRPSR